MDKSPKHKGAVTRPRGGEAGVTELTKGVQGLGVSALPTLPVGEAGVTELTQGVQDLGLSALPTLPGEVRLHGIIEMTKHRCNRIILSICYSHYNVIPKNL